VPTLVYRFRNHLISLTAVPASGRANSMPILRPVEGYNVLWWTDDGVAYWVLSDIEAADIENFAELFRTAPADR
jgi:anti-sigma factor RsiW